MKKAYLILFTSFIFVFILCLCFSSVFAGENLTINQFKEILQNNNITIPEDVEIPTELQTIISSYNPFIISSKDGNYIHIYPTSNIVSTFKNDWPVTGFSFYINGSSASTEFIFSIKSSKSGKWPYINNSKYSQFYNYTYDVINSTFKRKTWIMTCANFNSTSGTYGLAQAGSYINYKIDINNETVESFKSLNNLKNYLEDHLMFNGFDGTIYYNDKNVLYKFNGVYVGSEDKITGTTMWSNDDVGFTYTNTYPENETYFYLQDVPLSEITEWSANDYNTLNSKYNSEYYIKLINGVNFNYWYDIDSYEVTYNKISSLLEQGHIYRLYAKTDTYSLNDSR